MTDKKIKHKLLLKDISYSVGSKKILHSISIEQDEGELIGLIGPNGSGKTTLLKVMSGIIKPSYGSAYINGAEVREMKDKKRAQLIGYMPQDNNYNFHLNILDVVLFGRYPYIGRMEKYGRNDLSIAERMLEYVGFKDYKNRYFDTLSGGEKQLVVFAKVLAQETKYLFLDEPTSNLDIKHQYKLFSMAYELSKEGKIVITAVHNLNVASQHCDKLILLKSGSIVKEGSIGAVLTPEIISSVYDVKAAVSVNASTGARLVSVMPSPVKKLGITIHIIGGAGSGVNLTRELLRLGVNVTGGITHSYDSDFLLWNSAGVKCLSVAPFSQIEDEDINRAKNFVRKADLTVLCPFPIGKGNFRNLLLAMEAKKLIILEDSKENKSRVFFYRDAESIYNKLLSTAEVMNLESFLESINRGMV
ncbi:MAG: hypothetical protein DRP57_06510 [Spirochaetes bacterium]|nr:MAG: hypothetical protein DRP57_06510 [Spirochaetota bacterium]